MQKFGILINFLYKKRNKKGNNHQNVNYVFSPFLNYVAYPSTCFKALTKFFYRTKLTGQSLKGQLNYVEIRGIKC